jgi:cyclopropane fatty-acyl-phospholipid synthase-like methyltransferase
MKPDRMPGMSNENDYILEILHQVITRDDRRLLEIGSDNGQNAVFFAPHFPQVEWFPTDISANLKRISMAIAESGSKNIQKPARLEVGKDELPKLKFDIIFTANTFHHMHWKECKSLIKQFGGRLREGSRVVIAGPFKVGGNFTSSQQEELDKTLKAKDPSSGIRSFEDVNNAMAKNGFELEINEAMPDNNQLLIYRRLKFVSHK